MGQFKGYLHLRQLTGSFWGLGYAAQHSAGQYTEFSTHELSRMYKECLVLRACIF